LRNALVVIQFSISQILIISTIIISGQMDYFRTKELGYESHGIITVNIPDSDKRKLEVLRNRLLQNPDIENLTFSFGAPTTNNIMQTHFYPAQAGQEKELPVIFKPADSYYSETFDLDLLAGRWLKPRVENDSSYNFVVNSTLAKKMGIKNPEDAIGEYISVSSFKGEIIGVVNDFHMFPLHDEIMPAVLANFIPRFFREVDIKLNMRNTAETLNGIKTVWESIFPEYMFEFEFLDDYLGALYEKESRTMALIKMFTVIAIVISCLGLAGLVSLMIVQRTKEVGIRKVLGASIFNVVSTIAKEFLGLVIVANLIAWPVTYLVMNKWLQNFAYRIDIGVLPFTISAGLALLIAVITISYQVIRAARANPIDSLRYE
jgi:ABC-type antimicrobial peptide transport system permease subunit